MPSLAEIQAKVTHSTGGGGSYAPLSHSHDIDDVTGLQDALDALSGSVVDGGSAASVFAPGASIDGGVA